MSKLKQMAKGLALTGALASLGFPAMARETISIVGSSTVYPFATVVAEHFGRNTDYPTPKLESTGSGGGLQLFCQGVGVQHPDITNSSRRIKKSEFEKCQANGVEEIVEVKFGSDGIVLANAQKAEHMDLTLRQLFLALAKEVPAPGGEEKLVANPYTHWNEIDSALPDKPIRVIGPPPTSGTRDAFVELAMEGGCKTFPWIKAMPDDKMESVCHRMREDGAFVEAGENDNLIVQKLLSDTDSFGIFGYSFLQENASNLQAAKINGVAPTPEAIGSDRYPVARSLWFYIKKAHVGVIPGIQEYAEEFVSRRAAGENGYLTDVGLIPLPRKQLREVRERVENLTPMTGEQL